MSTRRSTRVRTREDDGAAETEDANKTTSSPPRSAKRARKNDVGDVIVDEDDNAVSAEWIHRTLPEDKRAAWDAIMKTHFFLHKPSDVYDLFELAVHVNPEKPLDAFVATAGVRLSGPIDLLSRFATSVQVAKPLCLHGRFFLDPPEVVAVLEDTESTSGAHWGLYRDKPSQAPTYVVYTANAAVCAFEPVAQSLLSVLEDRLQSRLSSSSGSVDTAAVQSQLDLIQRYSKRRAKSLSAIRSQRSSETLAASLHGLGIVVPYDAKKQSGFRELPITGDKLRTLLQDVASGDTVAKKKLMNLLTRATIANDECDFGTSLLLGLDLFTAGKALQKESLQMLRVGYMLLGRKDFAKVAIEHVKHRVEGSLPLNCLVETGSQDASTTVELP